MLNRLYPLIKLFFGVLVFLIYDTFHLNLVTFAIMFILGDIIILISDISLRHKVELMPQAIIWYVFYNYVGIKIILIS